MFLSAARFCLRLSPDPLSRLSGSMVRPMSMLSLCFVVDHPEIPGHPESG